MTTEALTAEDLAGILTAAGGTFVSPDTVRADIANGAPINSDGVTVNLVYYAAWLAKTVIGDASPIGTPDHSQEPAPGRKEREEGEGGQTVFGW